MDRDEAADGPLEVDDDDCGAPLGCLDGLAVEIDVEGVAEDSPLALLPDLRAVAFYFLVTGCLCLLLGLVQRGSLVQVLLGAYGAVAIVVGYGLWNFRRWALVVSAVLGLFGSLAQATKLIGLLTQGQPGVGPVAVKLFMVGGVLWLVVRALLGGVGSPPLAALLALGRLRLAWWRSTFFWLPIAGIAGLAVRRITGGW